MLGDGSGRRGCCRLPPGRGLSLKGQELFLISYLFPTQDQGGQIQRPGPPGNKPRETSLAAKKAGVRPPRLLPVSAPLRQAGPLALQSLPPHTRTHADRTHIHSSPATFRLDLVKADAPHSSPRGPQGLVLGIPVLSRLPAPACAWHHGAAVQPADGRGRGAPLALLSSQEKGSRSPKRLPLAVAVAGPDRSPQGPPCHPLPSESPPPLPPPCRREDGCSGRSAARPRRLHAPRSGRRGPDACE